MSLHTKFSPTRTSEAQVDDILEVSPHPRGHYGPLLIVLTLGLLVRLVLLYMMQGTGLKIVDEQHYHALALNVLHGHGFAKTAGVLTSIRPPLYPAFIALVWAITGTESLLVVWGMQIMLSLTNVFLLYRLGLILFNHRIALLAAAGLCLYPSLVVFNFLLLSEILFTALLTLMALSYVMLLKTEKPSWAWGTGCMVGLAALTRSILWPFPIVLLPLAFCAMRSPLRQRVYIVICLTLGYALVVGPWAVRNTKLQGVFTVVNTMGGITLRMGNYEHTPLNRAWSPVTLRGRNSIFHDLHQEHPEATEWTEGMKEKWAMKKALAYMRDHPLLTLKRSAVKFANFWGLERTTIAGWQLGFYRPPLWCMVLGTLLIPLAYIVLMLLASLGLFWARPLDARVHLFFLVFIVFVMSIHTIVFGHARYHLPYVPFLFFYAAGAVVGRQWRSLHMGVRHAAAPVAVWIGLLVIWGREVFVIEADRIQALLRAFTP